MSVYITPLFRPKDIIVRTSTISHVSSLIHPHYPLLHCAISLHLTLLQGNSMICEPRSSGTYISQKCDSNLPIPDSRHVFHYFAHYLIVSTVFILKDHLPFSSWNIYDPFQAENILCPVAIVGMSRGALTT